jgi:hypothetical protein
MLKPIAMAALAVSILASPPARAASPPTPEAIAEAKALLAAAQAEDLFTDASDGKVPGVRHKASGLVCTFEPGDTKNEIRIYPGLPRGDDVSCSTDALEVHATIYATRYPRTFTEDQVFASSVADIRQAFSDVQPFSGKTVSASAKGLPPHRVERFEATLNGSRRFTRIAMATVGEWTIMQRVTAPIDRSMEADTYGELSFVATLEQLPSN